MASVDRKQIITTLTSGDMKAIKELYNVIRGRKIILSTFLDGLIYTSYRGDSPRDEEVLITGEFPESLERLEKVDYG